MQNFIIAVLAGLLGFGIFSVVVIVSIALAH